MHAGKPVMLSIGLFLLTLLASEAVLCANGGKGKSTLYRGVVPLGQDGGEVLLSTALESVLFQLNSVRNKYKVIRIKIDNKSRQTLRLSGEHDRIALDVDNGTLPGILDVARHDPALWDALSADLRRTLAYPEAVEAGEEENIFVFIAKPELAVLPQRLHYTIASVSGPPVILHHDTPATAQ